MLLLLLVRRSHFSLLEEAILVPNHGEEFWIRGRHFPCGQCLLYANRCWAWEHLLDMANHRTPVGLLPAFATPRGQGSMWGSQVRWNVEPGLFMSIECVPLPLPWSCSLTSVSAAQRGKYGFLYWEKEETRSEKTWAIFNWKARREKRCYVFKGDKFRDMPRTVDFYLSAREPASRLRLFIL